MTRTISLLLSICMASCGNQTSDQASTMAQEVVAQSSDFLDLVCNGPIPLDFVSLAKFRKQPSRVKELQTILNDDANYDCWPNAAIAFGIVATFDESQVLIDYVEDPNHIAAGGRRLASYMHAMESLGALAGRYSASSSYNSSSLVEHLLSCSKPGYWASVSRFMKDEKRTLTGSYAAMERGCIRGLGYTNDPRGKAAIEAILANPDEAVGRVQAATQAQHNVKAIEQNWSTISEYLEP